MKSQMRLLECVLADASTWCSTSTTRDLETITRRVEHEGFSFLTITLPAFCQDFERGLEIGFVDSSLFMGFHKRGALPVFLRGLLSQVFDASTGTVLDGASSLAVHAVRQICMLHKKLLLDCSEERIRSSFDAFIETDGSVLAFEESLADVWSITRDTERSSGGTGLADRELGSVFNTSEESGWLRGLPLLHGGGSHGGTSVPLELEHFRSVSRILWGELFSADSFRVDPNRVVPRHGPGATAERLSGNGRYAQSVWHQRLDHWFPAVDFLLPNPGWQEALSEIQLVAPEHEQPVRVVAVPKTLKGPRIIAIEPACMQYTQQALMEILVDRLESYELSQGRINFRDQTLNQTMALESSQDGRHATIDLKDASDRVSARLVGEMLAVQPLFRELVFATRSLRADVPGHGVHHLARFASMGSAMCFPIEAMVFYTIVVSAIHRAGQSRLTRSSLLRAASGVRVYGDDIIVPVEYVQDVIRELEWFNLRVNSRKSFYLGRFRESCGLDAYNGTPVTPVYARRLLPESHRDTEELVSAVSLANQLYKAGYWRSCEYLRSYIERLATVPYSSENSSVLGWHSHVYSYEVQSWDKHLHRWLVRGNVVDAKIGKDPLEGYPALMKFLLKRGEDPYHDERHLERYGRPLTVYTKLRWVSPY